MSSTADRIQSIDSSFAILCNKYDTLKRLLDITPGGSSVHLPAMTEEPDPDRDLLDVTIVNLLNYIVKSNPDAQGLKELRAKYEKMCRCIEKGFEDTIAELFGGREKSAVEVLVTIILHTTLLETKLKYLEEILRFLEQANKEFVEVPKEEMREWRTGQVISYSQDCSVAMFLYS